MRSNVLTGVSVKGAALRGLLLGLVLQALLIAAVEISGPPIDPALAALTSPAGNVHSVGTFAQAHP